MAKQSLPDYAERLKCALRRKLRGCRLTIDLVRRDRYRFVVVSGKFENVGHPERQELVWNLADNVIGHGHRDPWKIGMIITMSPSESRRYRRALSRCDRA